MHTLNTLIDLLLGFVPMIGIAAILLGGFWIATKLIPGLNRWMHDTRDMDEAEEYNEKYVSYAPHSSNRW